MISLRYAPAQCRGPYSLQSQIVLCILRRITERQSRKCPMFCPRQPPCCCTHGDTEAKRRSQLLMVTHWDLKVPGPPATRHPVQGCNMQLPWPGPPWAEHPPETSALRVGSLGERWTLRQCRHRQSAVRSHGTWLSHERPGRHDQEQAITSP